jgi:transposase
MPTEKLSMRKIMEVLRLHYEQGCSNRDIARSVGISPSTVSTYLARAKIAGVSWPISSEYDEESLYARLFPPAPNSKAIQRPLPDTAQIHQELKYKGVTLFLLWHDYRSQYSEGYGYSRFCEIYREFVSKLKPSMRMTHYAGDKLFVDYSGLTVPWVDKETGVIHDAQIFVAVLGASNYTYVEATEDQGLRNWITSHIHAFEFFNGMVSCLIIYGRV